MKVLFLMILPVDINGNPNLYTDLMLEFQSNGHQVYAATVMEKKYGKKTYLTEQNGINVLNIRTGNIFGVGIIQKGLTTISLKNKFIKEIKKNWKSVKFDLVIMPTPPITFAGVMDYIRNRDSAKSYLILRDIFPQNAKDIGLMRSKVLFNYFRRKEKFMYRISDYIGCMSYGNIEYVLKHNPEIDEKKLELLPNWADGNIITENDFDKGNLNCKRKYGLDDKFVCIFGGNIGWPQELEFLIELATEYKDRQDIVFLIVGKGVKASVIKNLVSRLNLENVIIKDYLPREDYEGLLAECQLGLINLDRRFTIPNIPSKTLGYFSAGVPILASIDENTDYGKLLEDAKAGLWSVTGELQDYKRNLEFFLNNPETRLEMGQNGRKYLNEKLTTKHAYNIVAKHLEV